ncbi:MAG TPA: hypothetical protein VGP65_11780 [Candidatus Angelobacter sp.]|jgi:hypothetical protein|nr:hypothetical protein [Candidatus Angelobacter sp.]
MSHALVEVRSRLGCVFYRSREAIKPTEAINFLGMADLCVMQ